MSTLLPVARGYRSDLPPIVASWPAQSVLMLATGTVHSGLPGQPGSVVSIALPPRKKGGNVEAELTAGFEPETLAFGRRTRTTDKFHAHLKSLLTDIEQIGLVPVGGSNDRSVLVVRLRQGGVLAISLAAMTARSRQLLELQLQEIWTRAREGLVHWRERYGPDGLQRLSPTEFERLVAQVFESSGGVVIHTGQTGDGGIDVEVADQGKLIVVQCKRYRSQVGPGPVRELLGVLQARGADRAVLVSTGGFTDGARRFAEDHPITLLDAKQLAELARSSETHAAAPTATRQFASEGWPTPSRLGSWVSLNISATTPRFVLQPAQSIPRLAVTGVGLGLAGGFVFLIPLGIWAVASRTLLPIALLVAVAAIAVSLGIRSRRDEDSRRTPECSTCRHQSQSHRLATFSPYRLRLACSSCTNCDQVIPDPAAGAPLPHLAPLLYLVPPADGMVTIKRATSADDWQLVTTMRVWRLRTPIFLTDSAGIQGRSRYRFRLEPEGSLSPDSQTPVRQTPAPASAAPEQRCPKCRKRLRLSRHWEDGRGYWSCWTCGFSRELAESGTP